MRRACGLPEADLEQHQRPGGWRCLRDGIWLGRRRGTMAHIVATAPKGHWKCEAVPRRPFSENTAAEG